MKRPNPFNRYMPPPPKPEPGTEPRRAMTQAYPRAAFASLAASDNRLTPGGDMSYRDRKLLNMAYEFPSFLQLPGCIGGNGEPAHSNQSQHGKGGAQKAHDCFYVPACRPCHVELDQGRTMDRETKFAVWNRAYGRFLPELMERIRGKA